MSEAPPPGPPAEKTAPAPAQGSSPVLEQPMPLAETAGPPAGAAAMGFGHRFFLLRRESGWWQVAVLGTLCIALVLGLWWFLTRGEPEERIVAYNIMPSPAETFGEFYPELWVDRALTRNIYASLRRVVLGFGLAAIIGVPLGILAGCFSAVNAFLLPLSIFGRNIPVAALIPLTFSLFGTNELQKIMFIFIASVAFILSDSARAVADVDSRYIDTAYTLGAKRRQVVMKVLVPLALPDIFNSLRLLFGLAFGYIMLAELVTSGGQYVGLGGIINIAQRLGRREPILLILMIIPVVALAIDRVLFWVQKELFPHRYGGSGLLNALVRWLLYRWEGLKALVLKPAAAPPALPGQTGREGRS